MLATPELRSIMILDSLDKRRREYKRLGWIYAARNRSFVDPVYKIGRTRTSPSDRIKQLSASTSVYRAFELVYFVHVSDRDAAEGYAHLSLKDSRVNHGKEFFKAPVKTVVQVLDEAAQRWPIQLGRTLRSGFVEPALGKRVVTCPRCESKFRLPQLLVNISVTCNACGARHEVVADV